MQEVFREINETELREPKAEISHLLKTVIVCKLTESFQADLPEVAEGFLDLDLLRSQSKMCLNNLLQRLLFLSERCELFTRKIDLIAQLLGFKGYFDNLSLVFILILFQECSCAANQSLDFIFHLSEVIAHLVIKVFPLVQLELTKLLWLAISENLLQLCPKLVDIKN